MLCWGRGTSFLRSDQSVSLEGLVLLYNFYGSLAIPIRLGVAQVIKVERTRVRDQAPPSGNGQVDYLFKVHDIRLGNNPFDHGILAQIMVGKISTDSAILIEICY